MVREQHGSPLETAVPSKTVYARNVQGSSFGHVKSHKQKKSRKMISDLENSPHVFAVSLHVRDAWSVRKSTGPLYIKD